MRRKLRIAEAQAQHVIRAVVTVHAGHRVVAFRHVAKLVEQTDLFLGRKFDIDRLLDVETPDAFGAIHHERTIALFTGAQRFLRALPFRDVFEHRETVERHAVVIAHQHRGHVEPRDTPVAFDKTFFYTVTRNLSAQELIRKLLASLEVVGMGDIGETLIEQLAAGYASARQSAALTRRNRKLKSITAIPIGALSNA